MSNKEDFLEEVVELPEGFIEGFHRFLYPDNPEKGFEVIPQEEEVLTDPTPIRVLSKGAYQKRFTFMEEATLLSLAKKDVMLEVVLRRLDNTSYANLDDEDLSYATALVVNSLYSVDALKEGYTPSERIDELLQDGTPEEAYNGVL